MTRTVGKIASIPVGQGTAQGNITKVHADGRLTINVLVPGSKIEYITGHPVAK